MNDFGAFDTTLNVGTAGLSALDDESGTRVGAELAIGIVSTLPVGPGQSIPVPVGRLRWQLNKKMIEDLVSEFQKALEGMQDPPQGPKIEVASSLAGVDKAIAETQKFRG